MNTKQTEHLKIEGMSCGHCVAMVKRALGEIPGLDVQRVEVGSADVAYDPGQIDRKTLANALEEEGYSLAN